MFFFLDLSEDAQFENVAKAGQLMPGLELDIFDEEFNRLPHDGETVGEILVRGPWICSEYFNNPQPEKFHGDWLMTGDVGRIDREEYLIIADRSKEHLGTSDVAVIAARRTLLGLAKDLAAGKEPDLPWSPAAFGVRAIDVTTGDTKLDGVVEKYRDKLRFG